MIGTKLAHYEITSHLGTGGMGEVYQATDSKLGRSVAIKLLPEAFAQDTDRAARFKREARVLASLNHPNIAAIYGVEESGGRKFLVMELVPGETLAERVRRGAIPVPEALGISTQITEALEAAHEKGIVHRDLKPANIKITPQGRVKVLDFGLAKAFVGEVAELNLSNSPTRSMASTEAGVILGTAAYMSPEQAKGKEIDRTADIWAFGCVLYEMLTGRSAFEGETLGEILGSVFKSDPEWNRLPARTPASIQKMLRRTLKKDPRQRLGDIRDARIEIQEAGMEAEAPVTTLRGGRLAWIAFAAALLFAAVLAVPAVRHLRETPPPGEDESRLEISTPATTRPLDFALSPDGRYIVFVASGDGSQRLWLRALKETDAQPMSGTDGAEFPFWSADGNSIGFFASNKLYRTEISGGTPRELAQTPRPRGGTWNADGTILYAPTSSGPIFRIRASGSDPPTAATHFDAATQTGHRLPQFLPDGIHFLFYVTGTGKGASIWLGSLDAKESKLLTVADSAGAYLKPNWVVYVQQGTLLARRLDVVRWELAGDSVTMADPVDHGLTTFQGGFSVSADGRIAYGAGRTERRQLTWFDRAGTVVGVVGEPDPNNLTGPELSRDGRRVAVTRSLQRKLDVFLIDLDRDAAPTRFTFDDGDEDEYGPKWSPDGAQIAFQRTAQKMYLKPSNGVGSTKLLRDTINLKSPQDWSKDGFLLYLELDPKLERNLWALDMKLNDPKPIVVANTKYEERIGQISPDGHWVAYETNESSRFEIVAQPFPEASAKFQVSINGGVQPRWSNDGKEIYFVDPDRKLMVAPLTVSGGSFKALSPRVLFPTNISRSNSDVLQYAVSREGRFLINQIVDTPPTPPITLILNWNPEPRK